MTAGQFGYRDRVMAGVPTLAVHALLAFALLDSLGRNIVKRGAQDRGDVRAGAVEHVPAPPLPCDILFMDPPYGSGLVLAALERVAGWLAPGGWVSVETQSEDIGVPDGFTADTDRKFGKARIILLRRHA